MDDYYTKTRYSVGHARVEVLGFNVHTSLLAATKTKLQLVQRWRIFFPLVRQHLILCGEEEEFVLLQCKAQELEPTLIPNVDS